MSAKPPPILREEPTLPVPNPLAVFLAGSVIPRTTLMPGDSAADGGAVSPAGLHREANLDLTASVDPQSRVRAGRLLAAQHMIFGTIDAPEAGRFASTTG